VSGIFRSLRSPNYRIWAAGGLVSNIGSWMQPTAQDGIVLTELTDHSATAIGIVMGLPAAVSSKASATFGSAPISRQVLLMLFLIGTFGLNFPIFISTMSVIVFHAGAGAYGLLTSMMAAGSLLGALMAAARPKPDIPVLLLGAAIFGRPTAWCRRRPNPACADAWLRSCSQSRSAERRSGCRSWDGLQTGSDRGGHSASARRRVFSLQW
jgi:hypothetical protein